MRVGNKVICVNDTFPAWVHKLYQQLPVKNETYTVRQVGLGREQLAVADGSGKLVKNGATEQSGGQVYVLVEELRNGPDPLCSARELGFSAERFRELDEVSEDESLEVEQVLTGFAPT